MQLSSSSAYRYGVDAPCMSVFPQHLPTEAGVPAISLS